MTSVASFGYATSAGNFTLIFSGTTLGNWVQGMRVDAIRKQPVNSRYNLWASNVVLDGSANAREVRSEITLYTEANSRTTHAGSVLALNNFVVGTPQTLQINHGDSSTPAIDFGLVYLEKVEKEDDYLLYSAGFVTLTFIGTKVPEVLL